MATTALSPTPVFRASDNNGNPLYSGQLFTYAAGTTTPQTSYTDSTGATANTNPIILNSRGECNLWLNPSLAYKLVLEDSLGNLIWSVDNVQAPIIQIPYGVASGTNTILLNTTPAFNSLVDGLVLVFKAASTTTATSTLNVNSTGALNLYYSDGVTQLRAGTIIQNNSYEAIYNSSLNSGAGGWVVINPSLGDYAVTVGTNTITATIPGFTAYYDGLRVKLKLANTTTNTATLNINSIGAVNIYYSDLVTQIVAGALIQNGIYDAIYDSSLNSSAGGFIISSPSRVTGSFTITLTGMSAGTTGTANYAIAPDGKSVEFWIASAITGTSNNAAMTGTGIPTAIQPVTVKRPIGNWEDNTAGTIGAVSIAASSGTWTWSIGASLAGGGFTTSGTKGLPAGCKFNYALD